MLFSVPVALEQMNPALETTCMWTQGHQAVSRVMRMQLQSGGSGLRKKGFGEFDTEYVSVLESLLWHQ